MRINYNKSELIPLNLDDDPLHKIEHMVGIQPLVDKVMKRIGSWQGKLLSSAARVTLIQSCLASIPVYLLSFIKLPKWAITTLNSHFAKCLCDDTREQHKYHLVNWDSVCMCKDFRGLGIPNQRDLNICL